MELNNNTVVVAGPLSRNWYYSHHAPNGEGFFENEIEFVRLSGTVDRIQVMCSSVLLDLDHDYSGEYFRIFGNVRFYKANKDNLVKLPRLFVTKMEPCENGANENHFSISGTLGSISPLFEDEYGSTLYFRVKVEKGGTSYDVMNCAAFNRNALRVQKMEYGTPISVSGRLAHFYAKDGMGGKVQSFRCNADAIIDETEVRTNEKSEISVNGLAKL